MCRAVTLVLLLVLTSIMASPAGPPGSAKGSREVLTAAPLRGPAGAPAKLLEPIKPMEATELTKTELTKTELTKMVEYGGLRLPVPPGWPVYSLDREPGRCVRFDRHAIYLGRPGPEPDCPARLTRRTEALHIEPLVTRAGPVAEALARPWPALRPAGHVLPGGVEREVRLRLPEAGVVITATYGSGREVVERALRGSSRIGGWRPPVLSAAVSAVSALSFRPAAGRAGRRRPWTIGKGFDTCTAPSLPAMRAWRRTYRIANVYMGGAARGCAQPNLTRSWTRSVRRMGYRLIPTYVGLQAPCNKRYQDGFTMERPALEGRLSADDAVRRARALGISRRAPIYFDMEAYDSRKTRCREAVLRFLHAWSGRLHKRHYRSGVYSSVASGIRDLGLARGMTKPNAIWFAHWDRKARVHGDPYIPDSWWAGHRRIKQYRGGHKEKHGGVTINVDSNIVDGPVY
jgi:hypothetical protein